MLQHRSDIPNVHEVAESTAMLSRRQMMGGVGSSGGLVAFLVVAMAAGLPPPSSAAQATDELMWLTEPTDEFKENEIKAMEFRKAQLEIKKKFVSVLDELATEKNDEVALRTHVEDLQRLVIKTQGLPLGIKKQDLFKQIRAKKAKGYWPTSVEVAYV